MREDYVLEEGKKLNKPGWIEKEYPSVNRANLMITMLKIL